MRRAVDPAGRATYTEAKVPRRTTMMNATRRIDATARQTGRFVLLRLALIGMLALLAFDSAVPQEGASAIVWNKMFRLPDGRLFVSDGALTLDAELADLPELPGTELPSSTGDVMARYMAAERPDEIELDDLERGTHAQTYEAPNGLPFAAKYVEFLREAVPDASLRIGGDRDPVVIVADGRAVGLIMAMTRVTPP
jgi:hypothetical protein